MAMALSLSSILTNIQLQLALDAPIAMQTAHLSSYKIFHREDFFNVSSSNINVRPDYYKVPRGTSIDMPPLLILVATMGICKQANES